MPEPTPGALLAALRQAGWLLEQETASALTRAGFDVTQSWPYQDPEFPDKSREMDVVATKRVHLNAEFNFSVIAHVVAGCKESAMPYALIGRTTPVGVFAYERKETQFVFDRIEYDERPSPQGLIHKYVGPSQYLELHHLTANPWSRDFEATLLVRLDKTGKDDWSASNDGLMQQAMVPVVKVIDTLRTKRAIKNDIRASRIDAADGGRHHAQIALYFPLIVTSAPLFRVDATQEPRRSRRLRGAATPHVQFRDPKGRVSRDGGERRRTERVHQVADSGLRERSRHGSESGPAAVPPLQGSLVGDGRSPLGVSLHNARWRRSISKANCCSNPPQAHRFRRLRRRTPRRPEVSPVSLGCFRDVPLPCSRDTRAYPGVSQSRSRPRP